MNRTHKKSLLNISFGGIKDTDILLFTRHLSVSLQAGLTLVEGLEMLCEQATGKMKYVLTEIVDVVTTGQLFHKALEQYPKYFSPMYVNLVKTGEYTGTLEENLQHLAEHLWKVHDLRKKVHSAMIYPILVLVAVVGLAFSVSLFVLPKILPLFRTLDVELPITTKALLFVADLFAKHGLSISIGFMAVIAIGSFLLSRNFMKPFIDKLLLALPIVKQILKNINLARFSHTMATLLSSGIPVDASLQIAADSTDNQSYKNAVKSFIPQVEKGEKLATAASYHPKLFPPLVSRMIAMGEQTGSLGKTLNYLSEFYEQEVDSMMKNLATLLEPLLLMGIGVVVGTIAVAILGPIYQITGGLRK